MTSDARRDATHLAELLRTEHVAMVDFLLALADFDRRRGWAALGHASLWSFLHHDLGLSAGAAFQRKVAAALLRRVPAMEAPLRDGRLCLSSVAELAKVLTPGNQAEVLPRFFGKSTREARDVVAAIAPREVVPARVVVTALASVASGRASFLTSETGATHPGRDPRLGAPPAPKPEASPDPTSSPTPSPTPSPSPSPTPPPALPSSSATAPVQVPAEALVQLSTPAQTEPGARSSDSTARAPATSTRTAVEPLTADLRRLHVTVSRRFLRKLEAARSIRSHANPSGSIEALLEEGLDLLLARETKRLAAASARPMAAPRLAAPERVPAGVRRSVWARDGGRCQWPLEQGGVCGSTWQVELDHVLPRARGGPSTAENLRLLCRAHNAEAARRVYGEAWMARARTHEGA